jgi:hypothetical protein
LTTMILASQCKTKTLMINVFDSQSPLRLPSPKTVFNSEFGQKASDHQKP